TQQKSPHFDRVIRRWLAKTPFLHTAYLVRTNRYKRRRSIRRWVILGLLIVWSGSEFAYFKLHRIDAVSTLESLHRHDLFYAAISAVLSGMLILRQKALNQIAASSYWAASLPVHRAHGKWQAIIANSAPSFIFLCLLTAFFGDLSLVAISVALPPPTVAWAATSAGAVVGAALGATLGYVLPAAKREEMYEGSRYVPHRRQNGSTIPIASFSALGSWPVRQTFATARPKIVVHAIMPLLLCAPLGSSGADVMLAIFLLITLGALVLLTGAIVSVGTTAARWLKPVPLESHVLARKMCVPTLVYMIPIAVFESVLFGLLGMSIVRAVALGIVTLVLSISSAVGGSLLASNANDREYCGKS
ncbi:MAG: hypothetical protein WBR17_41390, partial [Paraburkholderia sp.]|uniref:hypothetical protein n=1 Tax=Paraburkholderia sp. TaxID=1926495 RepID=UPI003C592C37